MKEPSLLIVTGDGSPGNTVIAGLGRPYSGSWRCGRPPVETGSAERRRCDRLIQGRRLGVGDATSRDAPCVGSFMRSSGLRGKPKAVISGIEGRHSRG
jgi:hypothetical protein